MTRKLSPSALRREGRMILDWVLCLGVFVGVAAGLMSIPAMPAPQARAVALRVEPVPVSPLRAAIPIAKGEEK